MDEEIDDERKGLDTRSTPMRLRREFGTPGYTYGQVHILKQEAAFQLGKDVSLKNSPPFFREKIKDVVIKEGEIAVFSCYAIGEPKPSCTWFRNDGILIENKRIQIENKEDGRCVLVLNPARAYDAGCYKVVARNSSGVVFCRSRLKFGSCPASPEAPVLLKSSDCQLYINWSGPKYTGHSSLLEYIIDMKKENENDWTTIGQNIVCEHYLAQNLQPSTKYLFRVTAKNKFGCSSPSLESDPMATSESGKGEKINLVKLQKLQKPSLQILNDKNEDETIFPKLDYNQETNPVKLSQSEATEAYTFGDEISRGQFSVVVNSFKKSDSSNFASKISLIKDLSESEASNEFAILKTLCHERVVRVIEAHQGSKFFTLTMERLLGIDILTYLSYQQEYNEEMITRIIQQVLDGLDYLHFREVCLIELQPDNIVLTNQHSLNIKLIDFSKARHVPNNKAKVAVQGNVEYLGKLLVQS